MVKGKTVRKAAFRSFICQDKVWSRRYA